MWSSIISGTLLGFSLPALFNGISFHSSALAWIGLVPLYLTLSTEGGLRRALWKGFLCGFFLYGISLYWIFIALHTHGDISIFFSLLAMILLAGLLSLYLGGAFVLTVFLKNRGVPLLWGFSICWLLQDWLRNFFPFGGFSWSSLAYSQGERLNLIQIADLTGPYGVTFLILISNGLFGEVILFLRKRGPCLPVGRRPPWVAASLFTLLLCGSLGYGKFRTVQLGSLIESLPEKKLALVQGNIPQSEKWEPENIEELLGDHLELSRLAEKEHQPDLIIWPEASYPAVASEEVARFQVIDKLRTPLLMGVVSYDGVIPEDWPPPTGWEFHLYNSAMLIQPGGILETVYHKNHLVPMGEYIPLPRLFFFMEKLVFGMADFTPGGQFNLIDVGEMKIGVTICYEDLFPEISRRFVRSGANLLLNLTNDAWYEKSSAVPQHVEFSRFRAIENRRYLARGTNTGVTTVFDLLGQEVVRAPLFEKAVLPAIVRIGGPISFYTRYGDVFMILCLLFLVLRFANSLLAGRGVKRSAFLLMLACSLLGTKGMLHSQETGVSGTNLEFFHPAIDPLGLFGTNDARLLRPGQYSLKLSQSFAGDHLFPIAINSVPLDLVDTVLTTDIVAALGINEFLTAGLDVPFHLYAREGNINTAQAFTTRSVGDLRFAMKFRIMEEGEIRPRLAFLLNTSFPTGSENKFLGTSRLYYGIEFLTGKDFGFVDLMTTVGASFPQQKNILGLEFDDVVTYGAAMKVPFGFWDPKMSVLGEMRGHFMPNNLQNATAPLEFIAGLQKETLMGLTVNAGLGGASKNAIGNPRIRGLVTVSFSPRAQAEEERQGERRVKTQRGREELRQSFHTTTYFLPGSRLPTRESAEWVRNAAELMKRYPKKIKRVAVVGHTDSLGSREMNLRLSLLRAESVKRIMVEAGVDPSRIEAYGVGAADPVASDETRQGRILNRRVEIFIP